jgi:hypothetical protein
MLRCIIGISLIIASIAFLYLWATDIEKIHGAVYQIEDSVSDQLFTYYRGHGYFPDSLIEAKIVDTYRVRLFHSLKIEYKPSQDKEDFRLNTNIDGYNMYCTPNWREIDKAKMATSGFKCLPQVVPIHGQPATQID